VLLPLYHPLQIAEQLAMLDLMSSGRLEFGIGRGFVAHDYDVLGVPLEEARERMAESLEIILQAWTGKPFSYEGSFYRFKNVEVWPQPEQQPHPPVWVAATANPESFQWIAAHGHNLLTIAFARKIEHLAMCTRTYRDAWAAAGRDPAGFEIGTHYHVVVGEDGDEARETAQRATTRRVQSTYEAQALSTASAWGGYEAFSVEQLVDEGRLIAGDPEECVAIIRRVQRELGFTWLNSTFQFGDITFPRAQHSMELFASEVMPRLSAEPALTPR
jgi:alkanesulfonate monooxygenase SsuD/methylene tetrahydromethanopterin reductase-like flavin-dependent oxidoreductase (luciferase family)